MTPERHWDGERNDARTPNATTPGRQDARTTTRQNRDAGGRRQRRQGRQRHAGDKIGTPERRRERRTRRDDTGTSRTTSGRQGDTDTPGQHRDVWTTAGRADRRNDTGTSRTTSGTRHVGDNIETTPGRVDRQRDDTGTSRTTSGRPIPTRRRQHRGARATPGRPTRRGTTADVGTTAGGCDAWMSPRR